MQGRLLPKRAAGAVSSHTPGLQRAHAAPWQSARGRVCLVPQARKTDSSGTSSSNGSKSSVDYGQDWYQRTREAAQPRRTVKEEIEFRRQANAAANNGKERKDLYTDNWDGSEYKGGRWNILTFLVVLFLGVPVAGLAFAYLTYGTLWG